MTAADSTPSDISANMRPRTRTSDRCPQHPNMLYNTAFKRAILSSIIAFTACTAPQNHQEDLGHCRLHSANLGTSGGVSNIRSQTHSIHFHATHGAFKKVECVLPHDIQHDGQSLIVDGVLHYAMFNWPSFLQLEPPTKLYKDTFGNTITTARDPDNPSSTASIVVMFPLHTSSNGELRPFDIDLRPFGGPLVSQLLIGKTLSKSGPGRIVSDLDPSTLHERFHSAITGLIDGTDDVERLWSDSGDAFVEQIAVIDHPDVFAHITDGNPFTFLVSTNYLDILQHRQLDTTIVARHESLHILDRHMGYPSQSQAFQLLFESIAASHPSFFTAIDESAIFSDSWMGGHSADNAKELFASFLNMAMHYNATGRAIPPNLQATAHAIAQTLLAFINAMPHRSGKGLGLIRLLETICPPQNLQTGGGRVSIAMTNEACNDNYCFE
jgi:hypothetical protein